jgi:hypothetical protein
MELHLDMNFSQLVQIAKQLPKQEWDKLKIQVEQQSTDNTILNSDLEDFLLSAPTFSQEQLDQIANARTEINKWRTN